MYFVKKNEKKKVDLRAKPVPPRFNPRVMQVNFFLQVENINPPRQKVLVIRVDPAGSTHFAISISSNLAKPKQMVAFGILPTKITSNIDYHLERLPLFKLLVMLNVVFDIYK